MSKIKIGCKKMHHSFQRTPFEDSRRLVSDLAPGCAQPIVFDSNSEDLNAIKALTAARRFRVEASAAQNHNING